MTPLVDSAVTLVNPTPPTPYFLSNTILKDAVIYAHPAIPLYKVTSDSKQIRISDGSTPGRTIAVLRRRELLPNTVSFTQRDGRSQISVQKWLRKTKLPGEFTGYILQTRYGPYVWKSVSRHRQKVYANHDPNTPIASFYLHQTLSHGTPAFFLDSGAEPLRDDLVVAYLIQRHRIMMEDKALKLFAGLPTN
ncbi:hypothetical protein PAXRUDRAFT_137143 [Paxillus rubicundulus Ve08.2h10]|uniref:DUF6593 domain-containing protein n=1 Tax=Paxillus rubicundulus Ve08.2h10 TaxID=930991 RepID=A0A0D0EB21_9AGAM|nr:hypothetical protein PAXRUDRAFT_137143 [Paxillus rubicundulus Ve08.2h10]